MAYDLIFAFVSVSTRTEKESVSIFISTSKGISGTGVLFTFHQVLSSIAIGLRDGVVDFRIRSARGLLLSGGVYDLKDNSCHVIRGSFVRKRKMLFRHMGNTGIILGLWLLRGATCFFHQLWPPFIWVVVSALVDLVGGIASCIHDMLRVNRT